MTHCFDRYTGVIFGHEGNQTEARKRYTYAEPNLTNKTSLWNEKKLSYKPQGKTTR